MGAVELAQETKEEDVDVGGVETGSEEDEEGEEEEQEDEDMADATTNGVDHADGDEELSPDGQASELQIRRKRVRH